jgi:hypothetical protein
MRKLELLVKEMPECKERKELREWMELTNEKSVDER